MTRASSGDSAAKRPVAADLAGASVLVAGAGLAGLTAACDLAAMGAAVTVIEARERLGGRVWTIRDGFVDRQHAEAGGDMIDEQHHEIHRLAKELRLSMVRILKGGFAYARPRPELTRGAMSAGQKSRVTDGARLARDWLERRWCTSTDDGTEEGTPTCSSGQSSSS